MIQRKYSITIIVWFALLASCTSVNHLAKADNQNIQVGDQSIDPDFEDFIAPYREQLDEEMQQIIGMNASDLTKKRPNSSLGSVVSDLLHDQAEVYLDINVDFGVQNYGGLRLNALPKGPITKSHIFEIMPFDNYLIVLKMEMDDVKLLCDKIADSNGWPVSRGLSMQITDEGTATNILINGKPLEQDRMYNVVMSDYIANGGDACDFLKDNEQINCGVYIRNALIERITTMTNQGYEVEPINQERIRK